MSEQLTNADLVKLIIEEDIKTPQDDEEIIHLLLDKTLAENINKSHHETYTIGDKISDKMAVVAGSWTFIILFMLILSLWILTNSFIISKPFDAYPFILLNLVLSCLAAIQAPVIMMSQNRQEHKDRIRAENDYKINLKSELIIEDLHIKLDQMIENQEQLLKRLEMLERSNK
ncbi:MAG: DUF1003 domain-containing protein [Acidaminobacter sp.]|uniref:DUF1003 domain-containing protein n=1 Tax=Acidaminobacter sp. TaxID=1872102 RepID=UPI001381D1BA|nr:DUF1003 domain-containing protein [Acidaminobacter sp.]MZQ98870.1 DUF1003 domain-containing protein [Acidaminobacter sp.]